MAGLFLVFVWFSIFKKLQIEVQYFLLEIWAYVTSAKCSKNRMKYAPGMIF